MQRDMVLIGDRNKTSEAINDLLNQTHIPFEWAETVKRALAMLTDHSVVVLLDSVLPDGPGIEILNIIQNLHLNTKVAVVCGGSDSKFLDQVVALRPNAIFGKPLDFEDFGDWVNEIFQFTTDEMVVT